MSLTTFVALLVGLLAGGALTAAVAHVLHRSTLAREVALAKSESERAVARLEAEGAGMERAQEVLRATFAAASRDALKDNAEQVVQMARTELERVQGLSLLEADHRVDAVSALLAPVTDQMARFEQAFSAMGREQALQVGTLASQVELMRSSADALRLETGSLAGALKSTGRGGRWGELQLRRVAELAGMIEHCDFTTQTSVASDEGLLRPDMVVRMPANQTVVVDSKVSLASYLAAIEATDPEVRGARMKQHAADVRSHITALGRKAYWEQFPNAPEFVVMFLPGEACFSAALEVDPTLIEVGVNQRIILATPTTLIALLRVVAFGWRQSQLTEHAAKVGKLGRELYDRIGVVGGHLGTLGRHLENAVKSFNSTVSSVETRLLVTGRKLKECGVSGGDDITELTPIGMAPTTVVAAELTMEESLPVREPRAALAAGAATA
jgi:DNA recombination protein RmuC